MKELQFFLFGLPRLECQGQPEPVNRRKMLALLGYLLVTGQPHSRESLATLFWPDFDSSSALANLRRDLSRLKEILGDGLLRIDREKVQVDPGASLWSDVRQFEHLVQQVEQHGHFHTADQTPPYCAECQSALEEAAALYTSSFMAGFNLPDSPPFDEWQFFQAERLRGLAADIFNQLAQWDIERGHYEHAILPARRWLSLDPLHEPATRLLMRLYAWTGQHSAALRQYSVVADLLEKELGVEPEAETAALCDVIRARQLAPPNHSPKPPASSPTPQIHPADRFLIETHLSTGGFGEIYLGQDRQTGSPVAIKRLQSHLVASRPELVERFVREGEALGRLSHPNIVPMLAFYEHAGTYNLVMEYLPGGTLRDLLDRERPLPVNRTLEIALELADALSRAHHLHILHRDLKPENILLDSGGHPRLIDFGLALLQGSSAHITQAGMLLGSPAYMSPEALRGEELDQRSDVWAFGVLLYEMLTGTPPFQGEQIPALMQQILNQAIPPLHSLRPDLPQGLELLVAHMLEKDREQRLPSMRQAAAQLEAVNNDRGAALSLRMPVEQPHVAGTPQPTPVSWYELPSQPTPFIGRDAELGQLDELLGNPTVRMITLIGTGGIGKTRLAIEAAARNAKYYPNGTVFVPLAPVANGENIVLAIANAMLIRFSPGAPPIEQLAHYLSNLSMLLVLDNFEHLLDASDLISDLLAQAPQIQMLVTSRERLNIVEEWVYEIGGLPYPQPSETIPQGMGSWLANYSAVQLFIERARRADPRFHVDERTLNAIIEICRLVEGMPLAIELAAPWVRAMNCVEIAQELTRGLDILNTSMRNLPDRHRSVRVVFDRSWETLLPEEQSVLARLSVFHNGSTREAAEKVAGAKAAGLMTLVNKALLRHRGNRFEMHELLRQYAAERLGHENEHRADTLKRHHRYFLELLELANPGLKGGRQLEILHENTVDIDNYHSAWDHAVQTGDFAMLARAAETYWLLNEFRGSLIQGEAAFREAIEALDPHQDDGTLAGFFRAAQGSLMARQWRFEPGHALMEQGIHLMRQANPVAPEKLAFSLAWLGFLKVNHGQFAEAERAAEESLSYYPQTGDRWTQAGALRLLGASALYQGKLQRAQEYLNRCVEVSKSLGELRIRTYATSNLGVIHLWFGQFDQARLYFEESLHISKNCNDLLSRADALTERVRFLIVAGEYEQAAETAEKSIRIYRDLGRPRASLANILLGKSLHLMGKKGAKEVLMEGLESARLVNHRPDIATGLEVLGTLSLARQDFDQGQRYLDEALQIWTEIGNEPEMSTLLCWSAYGLMEAGVTDSHRIREKLVMALQLARNHQALPVVITAIVGLATLHLREGNAALAARVFEHARLHPSTPQEVRRWMERQGSPVPDNGQVGGSEIPGMDWESLVKELA